MLEPGVVDVSEQFDGMLEQLSAGLLAVGCA
jgi:hypothetical protein